ncbi:MAG: hypothetical protein AMXMBFR13_23940 [Phycisphaerae bacterium]
MAGWSSCDGPALEGFCWPKTIVALAFSTVLDGGELLSLFSIVLLLYWGAVLFSIARRETFAQAELTLNWVGWVLPLAATALLFL